MIPTKAYATFDAHSPFKPHTVQRRDPGAYDVLIDIAFCGICHSDLHTARGEWHGVKFPVVPGHEIVGRVSRVGGKVSKFKAGDTVGVGCFVGSCGECARCKEGLESYCEKGAVGTYNGVDSDGQPTYGGYSKQIVVPERFVLRVDAKQKLEAVAPLLCAGITTWSPLKHWKVGKGHKVGVLGLGGLGHMAVKLASALGAEVTLISGSPSKKKDAERLGASGFVPTAEIGKVGPRFDLIIDTVSAKHDLGAVLSALKFEGTAVLLGASPEPLPVAPFPLIFGRRSLSGSLVGGIPETQEVLDFCAAKNITADVETVPIQKVDDAYERMLKGDVRYRFSIDLASLT
jgi:uncharacterized zinc-type alcohol dehydrogenase-like protein